MQEIKLPELSELFAAANPHGIRINAKQTLAPYISHGVFSSKVKCKKEYSKY